jgi:hypothetical protein
MAQCFKCTGVQPNSGKGPHQFLWTGSRAARVKFTHTTFQLPCDFYSIIYQLGRGQQFGYPYSDVPTQSALTQGTLKQNTIRRFANFNH